MKPKSSLTSVQSDCRLTWQRRISNHEEYLIFFVMLLPLIANAAWIDSNGKTIPDTESMRSDGDFGAQIVLAPDDKHFRQIWNSTKDTPNLQSTDSVKLGASISAVLIFHGCTPNPTGSCDVVSEFFLQSPDGKQTPAGSGPVWSSAPLQKGLLQLGLASVAIGFDSTDPIGDYKIIAKVKDKNSGRSLTLIARFSVIK
jgi:hypothetical protein